MSILPTLMQRRQFLAYTSALAALSCLAGCARSHSLNIAIFPWIGYAPLYLARDFGWLPAGVSLVEGGNTQEALDAVRQGRADGATLTLDEVLRARASGLDLAVVMVFNESTGADVLLARPGISALADLAGRPIGVEHTAVGMLMLVKALQAGGLALSDVEPVDLAPDRQLEAWRQGKLDAVVSYEPHVSLLLREGAVRLFDSRSIPDTILDVLAVRRDRLASVARLLTDLMGAHFQALEHIRANRQDALHRIAGYFGVQPNEVRSALAGIDLPDLFGNRIFFGATQPLDRAARSLAAVMIDHGLLSGPMNMDGLLVPDYLPVRIPSSP